MKQRSHLIKAVAAAAALACVAGAHATGTFAVTGGAVLYATEALGPSTALTLPTVTYTIGVPRGTSGQDFALIYKLKDGATFVATPPAPVLTGAGVATITLKRGGAGSNDVVYSVSPTTAIVPGDVFTLMPGAVSSHGLTGNGANFGMQITVLDQNETACVDNSGTPSTCFKSVIAGTTAQASNFVRASALATVGTDAEAPNTTTDVNAVPPLAGFVADVAPLPPAPDTATQARALMAFKGTTPGVRLPDNSADFGLGAGDAILLTITDPTGFLGAAPGTSGLFIDLNGNTTQEPGEQFARSGNTATISIPGAGIPGTPFTIVYTAAGGVPMGTGRVLGLSGAVDPAVVGIPNLTYTGNASWWTWISNGTILETPFFTTFAGQNSRFVFMNYGPSPVTYSADCLVETGNTRTLGPGATGTFAAGQQTIVPAASVCTFSGATRGSARFTINAPNTVVKGVANVVNENTGGQTTVEMTRPGTN